MVHATPTKKPILVVDDEPEALAMATLLLEDDYDVVTAKSVAEARDALQQRTFWAALVDYHLGEENGAAVIDLLLKSLPGERLLLVTADHQLGGAGQLINVIFKPYDPQQLLQRLLIDTQRQPVLVVDTNEDSLAAAQDILGEHYDVVVAKSVDEALAHIKERAFAVALVDSHATVAGGGRFAEELARTMAKDRILVATTPDHARVAETFGTVKKPYRPGPLRKSLAVALGLIRPSPAGSVP